MSELEALPPVQVEIHNMTGDIRSASAAVEPTDDGAELSIQRHRGGNGTLHVAVTADGHDRRYLLTAEFDDTSRATAPVSMHDGEFVVGEVSHETPDTDPDEDADPVKLDSTRDGEEDALHVDGDRLVRQGQGALKQLVNDTTEETVIAAGHHGYVAYRVGNEVVFVGNIGAERTQYNADGEVIGHGRLVPYSSNTSDTDEDTAADAPVTFTDCTPPADPPPQDTIAAIKQDYADGAYDEAELEARLDEVFAEMDTVPGFEESTDADASDAEVPRVSLSWTQRGLVIVAGFAAVFTAHGHIPLMEGAGLFVFALFFV